MSASKSKTKETSQQTQTSSGTATTTPNTPDWLQQPWMKQAGDISALQNSGQPLIAGAQPLQQQAFASAMGLGKGGGKGEDFSGPQINGGGGDGYSNGFDLAQALGLRAANAPANTATATGYNPAGMAGGQGYTASGMAGGQGYAASGPAGGQGYTSQGYSASGAAGGEGYGAAGPAAMQGYGAAGPAAAQGYAAPALGGAAQAANRNLTDVDLGGYFNPFEQRVVDTTLADFDQNSGRIEAQQRAQQAANGGLRNSNNAIAQAVTQGELARGRASTDANLRYQGFNTATGLAQTDLGRETANSQFNAGQANSYNLAKAQMEAEAARFGADAGNRSALDFTGRTDAAGAFGADAFNRGALDFTGRTDTASQYGAAARNQSALDYAGRNDQAGAFGASAGNAASQFGAASANQSGLDYAGRRDQAGQFGADAFNSASRDLAGRADSAGQFGANAFNDASRDLAGRTDQAGQFGAASQTQNSMFNAGQQDNALTRMLQSAGLLSGNATAQGNMALGQSADQRANIGLQADLGGQQRDIANSQSQAANLALIQQLLGGIPLDQFTGRTVNESGSSSLNRTGTGSTSTMGGSVSDVAKIMAMFSDRRLKTDVIPAGRDAKGRKWYDYRYLWDDPDTVRRGVMAQEIQDSDPDAIGMQDGFFTVDYSKLGMA